MDRDEHLRRGRTSFAARAWSDAHEALSQADQVAPLDADDLERLATAAHLVGDEDGFVQHLDRAHRRHLDDGEVLRAARCAWWAGIACGLRGEHGPANGWFQRARRLVARSPVDGPERGYLLIPLVLEQAGAQRWADVAVTASEAARVADRFDDPDLFALAAHEQGHALVRQGRPDDGFALLDEAMLAVTGGRLSPVATGIVYCSVIAYCQDLHDLRRAREWTQALTRWCGEQPQLVAYTGQCLVHQAELLQAGGEWRDALAAAHDAQARLLEAARPVLAGSARYREGELHRLRGELHLAEDAYQDASRRGWRPEPGLALLRLAEGRLDAARASIHRALAETTEPLDRAALLPASVEIALAVGDVAAAADASRELSAIAEQHDRTLLHGHAAAAAGALALTRGDAPAALVELRRSWQAWLDLDVPYEAARSRVSIGMACRELGDEDAAALELAAAREVLLRLGARPEVERIDALSPRPAERPGGLTRRELEVLRLVASGRTNRAIAGQLVVSERTVDRHVSNILTKLGLPSRAAATAYAYEHELVGDSAG